MKILQIGNPILEQKTRRVENIKDPKVQKLITQLEDSVRSDEESAGLAAPQIGESIAICTVKVIIPNEESKDHKIITLINPRVVKSSSETSVYWEGCLSVGEGDDRLFGPIRRPTSVSIEYTDKNGKNQLLEAHGYFAHIVQHEVDHMNGILFVKYITNPLNIWKNKDLDEYIEENGEFPSVIGEKVAVPEMVVD